MLCLRIKFHVGILGLRTIQYTYTYDKVIAYYNNLSEIDNIEKIIRYVLHTRAWILLFETIDVQSRNESTMLDGMHGVKKSINVYCIQYLYDYKESQDEYDKEHEDQQEECTMK